MILEIAIASVILAGGAGVARAWRARRSRAAEVKRLVAAPKKTRGPGLWPGDVVQVFHEDFALEACTEIEDGSFFARVFEVVADARCIVQLDVAGEEIVIGKPAEVFEGRVPDRIDTGGRILMLQRRGAAMNAIERRGPEPTSIGKVDYVVLGDKGGQRLIVLDRQGSRIALSGELLHLGSVSILPGS